MNDQHWVNRCHVGDCREWMSAMIAQGVKVQMCVTSPPYWGLRQYLFDGAVIIRRDLDSETKKLVETELAKLNLNSR